jgi:hypothetical protein
MFSTHIFIYMLVLAEGQTSEVLELSTKQCSFGNRGALDRQALSFSHYSADHAHVLEQGEQ